METAFELVSQRAKDPPAASRAYALLAVAMYDAVVAASYWQEVYRREARSAAPDDRGRDVAAYPSEHAAIAGAGSRLLAYLFPEQPPARFEQMAEAAAASRVASGASSRGDVQAGLRLGRAVAARVIARANNDGARRRWRGDLPRGRGYWRPPPGSVGRPVSPLAGNWRTWVLRSGREVRPPPPPPSIPRAFGRRPPSRSGQAAAHPRPAADRQVLGGR